MANIRIGGDLGDAVYSLPVIKAIAGGPHDIFFVERRPTVAPFLERETIVRPLYEAQPYVRSVTLAEGDVDLDLTIFRRNHSWRYTLPVAQKMEAERQGIDMSHFDQKSAWLSAPEATPHDRVLIHRSPRYNNPHFPWATVVRHFGKRCLFTGLPHEHAAFQKEFGVTVEHALPPSLLDLATLAAGAQVCIGNQSSPFSVFEGLKVPRILEVCLWQPDCVFPPSGNHCVADGQINFEGLTTPPVLRQFSDINRNVVPPGSWQYEDRRAVVFDILVTDVAKDKGIDKETAAELVYAANCKRRPDFFRNKQNDQILARFHGAAASVGYPINTL